MEAWEPTTLRGLRAGSYMNFGLGIASLIVVATAFWNMGIIGKAETTSSHQAAAGGTRDVERGEATSS